MFSVTFYSFKGGVGRTLALVNVAAECARRGKRVLIVDFDLEAPGIETFPALAPPTQDQPGLLDFVSVYSESGKTPNVLDYVYRASTFDKLWVMRAGRRDTGYSHRLASVDWQDLYDTKHGFLMFEDLKTQWETRLAPDYVFIDSRTGHTDVGGICTRQLPDAAVMMFVPNDQNLAGLPSIVAGIRGESSRMGSPVKLLFVASNVPNLDDENRVLAGRLSMFEEALACNPLTAVIHHYDSWDLLNQDIFTDRHPNARLSHEYRSVADAIRRVNVADRDGVIVRLKEALSVEDQVVSAALLDDSQEVRAFHPNDGEILYLYGLLMMRNEDLDDALSFFDAAGETGYRRGSVYRYRAHIKRMKDDSSWLDDVKSILRSDDATAQDLRFAVDALHGRDPAALASFGASAAYRVLRPAERCSLVEKLLLPETESVASELARQLFYEWEGEAELGEDGKNALSLVLIHGGEFGKACALFGRERPMPGSLGQEVAFNYGVAEWGAMGAPRTDMFERVLELDVEPISGSGANHKQCIGLAYWIVGRKEEALTALRSARRSAKAIHRRTFDCWRYLNVSPAEFIRDVDEMILACENGEVPRLNLLEAGMKKLP